MAEGDFDPEAEREALTKALEGTTAARKAGGTGPLVDKIVTEGLRSKKRAAESQPSQPEPVNTSQSQQNPKKFHQF